MKTPRSGRRGGGQKRRARIAPVYLKPPDWVAIETILPSHTGEAVTVSDGAKDESKKAVRSRVSRIAEYLKLAWLAVKLAKEVVGLF